MANGSCFGTLVRKAHVLKSHVAVNRTPRLNGHRELLGLHNASDASQRIGTHLRGLAHKHELGHGRRHHGRKYRVKREVGHKACEVSLARRQQQCHGQQECHKTIERGKVEYLRTSAERARIALCHVGVFGNRIVEGLEGVDRLLKHLDHGDAAYVFGAGLVHLDQRSHVGLHELGAFAAHHGGHGAKRNDDRDKACHPQTPIEGEKQHEQAHDHGGGAGDIGQHVREQGLGGGGASVYNTAQLTGGVRVKVAKRQLKQVLARSLADIGRAAKRRQVRAHEPHEINYDACQGKTHGPPAIHRDVAGFAPVRCHGDQIARDKPNAHVRAKAQQLRERRERHAQIR